MQTKLLTAAAAAAAAAALPSFSFILSILICQEFKWERKRYSWVVDWFDYLEVEIDPFLCVQCTLMYLISYIYRIYLYKCSSNVHCSTNHNIHIPYVCQIIIPSASGNGTQTAGIEFKQKPKMCYTVHTVQQKYSKFLRLRIFLSHFSNMWNEKLKLLKLKPKLKQ